MSEGREPGDRFDHDLDRALATLVRRSPDAGFRGRVQARLAEPERSGARYGWPVAATVTALLLAAVAAYVFRGTSPDLRPSPALARATPSPVGMPDPPPAAMQGLPEETPRSRVAAVKTAPMVTLAPAAPVAAADGPREETLAVTPLEPLVPMRLQPMDNASLPLAPLEDERLAITPLESPDDGSPGQEEGP